MKRLFTWLIVFLLSFGLSWSATYYIDADAGDTGVGTEGDPFNELSDIPSLSAGDTVYLQKGDTWQEMLTIAWSGTSGNEITITAYGSGARPIIDGTGNTYCIYNYGHDYIVLDGLHLTKGGTRCLHVAGTATNWEVNDCQIDYAGVQGIQFGVSTSVIEIDSCTVEYNGSTGLYWGEGSSDHDIHDSTFAHNGQDTSAQYASGINGAGNNTDIYNNTVYDNCHATVYNYGHGIYIDTNTTNSTCYNNMVYNNPRGHGINVKGDCDVYFNTSYGNYMAGIHVDDWYANNPTINIYYNICYNNHYGFYIGTGGDKTGDLTLTLYNNVFFGNNDKTYDDYPIEIRIEYDIDTFTCKNNIVYGASGVSYAEWDIDTQSNATIDYNCTVNADFRYNEASRTWTQWKTDGWDANGLNDDPEFIDQDGRDFEIGSGSPCIEAGTDVSLSTDYFGNAVPAGEEVDIGAHEYPDVNGASIFYVNADADDGGDGTTTATTGANCAWNEISDIAGLSAGDFVLFDRGDTWREQLTVPSSGTSGNSITLGAYGSGTDPIINGADLVGTWTEYTENWAAGTMDGESTSAHDRNYRIQLPASTLSQNGDRVRIELAGHTTQTITITACYIGEKAASGDAYDMESGTITEITFSGGSGCSISVGGSQVSDWVSYDFDYTKDYLISIGSSDHHRRDDGHTGIDSYYKNDASGDAGTANVTGYTTASDRIYFIDNFDTKYNNTWKATFTRASAPAAVWFNDTVGTLESDIVSLSAAREWYWASNVLYVYSTSDPDTAYTSPGIEASNRVRCIYGDNKDYITIENLDLKHANSSGIKPHNGSDNWIVDTCDLHDNGHFGILVFESNNCTIKDCTIHDQVLEEGIYIDSETADSNDGTIIENCIIYDNYENGIYVHGTTGNGIGTTGVIIRYNHIYGNDSSGGGNGNGIQITDVDGVDIYYNLLDDNGLREVTFAGSQNIGVYNNVINNVADSGYPVVNNNGCTTGINIKNNIIQTSDNDVTLIKIQNSGAATIDNNCYYSSGNYNNAWHWNATDYDTFAAWKTGSSQDANSVNSDPLMTDPANGDFTLQATSPCVDAGTNVSLTRDYAGDPVPQGVTDIGAYENVLSPSEITIQHSMNFAMLGGLI